LDVTAGWLISILRDRWIVWDLASAALIFGVIGAALVRREKFRFEPLLGYGAAGLWIACLLLPQKLFGSGYAAGRLVPYAVAATLIGIRPARSLAAVAKREILIAGVAFCVARLALGSVSYAMYGRDLERELPALNAVPNGSTVLAFVESGCDAWANPRVAHLPSYAIVRRASFSNDQWQTKGGQLLTVTYDQAGKFEDDPSSAVEDNQGCPPHPPPLRSMLPYVPLRAFDYVWLIGVPHQLWPRAAALRPVWENSDSIIFHIDHSQPAPVASFAHRRTRGLPLMSHLGGERTLADAVYGQLDDFKRHVA
jgi:hypothetical protein